MDDRPPLANATHLIARPHAHSLQSSVVGRRSSVVIEHVLPLLLFGLLGVLLTWPLALHLGAANPAPPGDSAQDLWEKLWNLWWAVAALRRGVSPLWADTIFYPQGASLLFHPLSLPSGWLVAPITASAGPVAAYNIVVLLSFALSGYFVYLLARRHGCARGAALIGGLAFSASSFHIVHIQLSHLELIPIQWLPLYALALDNLATGDRRQATGDGRQGDKETGDRRQNDRASRLIASRLPLPASVLTVALTLLLIVFTSLYMALYAAILTAVWVAWLVGAGLLRGARRELVRPLLAFGAAMLLVALVVVPVQLLPMQREASDPRNAGYTVRSIDEAASRAAAPADVLLPPPYALIRRVLALPAPLSNGSFVGYVALALAVVAVLRRPRVAGRWVALAALAWLLALGPDYPFYRALYRLPGFQFGRYPDRFGLLAILSVSVLAAVGADVLLNRGDEATRRRGDEERRTPFLRVLASSRPRVPHPASRVLVAAGLFTLMLLELHPGASPLTFPLKDPYYDKLARDTGDYSVLELPITRLNSAWLAMYGQTQHRHPILDGALARRVPRLPFEDMPLLREIERPAARDIIVQSPEARRAALAYFKLGTIIYHRSDQSGAVTPPSAATIAQATGAPVTQVYADAEFVAYQIEPTAAAPALPAIIALGKGWNKLEAPGPDAHRWLRLEGGLVELTAPQDVRLTLRLNALAYKQPQKLTVELDGTAIAQLDVPLWRTDLTLPLAVRAGAHTLRLVASGPGVTPRAAGAGADDRPLTIGVWALEVTAN